MAAVTAPVFDTGHEIAEATIANLALARLGADLIKDTTEDTPSSRQAKAIFGATRDELLRDYEFNFAQRRIKIPHDPGFDGLASWSYAYSIPPTMNVLKVLDVAGNQDNIYEYFNHRVMANVQSGVAGIVQACTVADITGVVTPANITQFSNGYPVFLGGTTAPAGLVLGTFYWVVNKGATTFGLAAYPEGPAILTTSTGTDVTVTQAAYLDLKVVVSVVDPSLWDTLFNDAFVLRAASKMAVPLTKRADLAQFLQGEFAAIYTLAKTASSKERMLDESETPWTARQGK